jgi:hypothetical protein
MSSAAASSSSEIPSIMSPKMPFFRTPIKNSKKGTKGTKIKKRNRKNGRNRTKKQKISKHNNARYKSNNRNNENNENNENNDYSTKSDPYLIAVKDAVVNNFNIDKERLIVRYVDEGEIEIIIDGCEEESLLDSGWFPYAFVKNILTDEPELHIETLTSCTPLSGSAILNSFIEIARDIGLKYVRLYDASTVYFGGQYGEDMCAVSLAILDILVGGRSWYYHMGFRNENNDKWLNDNITIALFTKFKEFIKRIIIKEVRKKMSRSETKFLMSLSEEQTEEELNKIIQPVLESMYGEIRHNFPDVDLEEDIVSNAIYKMIQSIRKEKTCPPRLQILQRIVRSCRITFDKTDTPVIKYDPYNLVLTL